MSRLLRQTANVFHVNFTSKSRVTEARDLYNRASAIDSTHPDEALKLYQEALVLDPHLAIAEINIGVVKYNQGKVDVAFRHFLNANRSDPEQPEAHYNLGVVLYLDYDEPREALAHIDAAHRLDPDFSGKEPGALIHRGDILWKLGRWLDARVEWVKYVNRHPHGQFVKYAKERLHSTAPTPDPTITKPTSVRKRPSR